MQRHINAKLHDNDVFYYAQLYFYNPAFAIELQKIQNLKLNPVLLCQLIGMLYICNPFIWIYKIAAERI